MPTHLELLVNDDFICLKNWMEIDEEMYESDSMEADIGRTPERSLVGDSSVDHMDWPGNNSGIFHTKLPTSRLYGAKITGEELLVHMPDNIKGTYTAKMAGKYFRCASYSWIDPTDPSMGAENSDAAVWTVGVGFATVPSVWPVRMGAKVGGWHYTQPAFNSIGKTYNTKSHPLRESRHSGAPCALLCYRPFTDTSFMDASYTIKYNKAYGFSTNTTSGWESGTGYDYVGHMTEALPTFVVTNGGGGIDADAYETVDFKMVDSDGSTINHATDVYLEHTGGYLPKQRVSITDGTGSFKVGALGMSAGDTFKVKIGFRNYSGLADVDYTVA